MPGLTFAAAMTKGKLGFNNIEKLFLPYSDRQEAKQLASSVILFILSLDKEYDLEYDIKYE